MTHFVEAGLGFVHFAPRHCLAVISTILSIQGLRVMSRSIDLLCLTVKLCVPNSLARSTPITSPASNLLIWRHRH